MTIDPVTLALVQNRLDNISLQMGWVMTRTARSPIFNTSHDFSCFLSAHDGTLISNADGIPIHTGGGGFATRAILRDFAGRIEEGDVFLLNDPYVAGGNHLPDWVIARPVFVDGRMVALACNRAHQSDIGGGAAGTYNSAATEIFHEGIRLPVLKLIERGETRDDLWNLLLLNCRTPDLLDGDLRAMIGSTRIGGERVASLVEELGTDDAERYFDAVLDHADRRFRQVIADLPDGVYEAVEISDNDCFEPIETEIRVKMTIDGDTLDVDFTGTGPQMKGYKNSSVANTYSAVYMGLASFFEPDIPRNEGTFRCVTITAPKGSVVNPRPPAPMTMNTVFIAHEIVHATWKALSQADETRSCAGWAKSVHGVTSGREAGAEEPFVMYHWPAMPGGGAVEGRDGFNQIGLLIALGGLTMPNIEAYEQLFPCRVHRQEFRRDVAGPGEYRGGSGAEYEVELTVPATHSFRGDGVGAPSGYGVVGGSAGQSGYLRVEPEGRAAFDAPAYGVQDLPALRMVAASPGGGGWGDPLKRDPAQVLRDVRDDVVSEQAAAEFYGVRLSADGRSVDEAATEALRTERRQAAE